MRYLNFLIPVLAIFIFSIEAHAHFRISISRDPNGPSPMLPQNDLDSNKVQNTLCGVGNGSYQRNTSREYEVNPGDQITLNFVETINHQNCTYTCTLHPYDDEILDPVNNPGTEVFTTNVDGTLTQGTATFTIPANWGTKPKSMVRCFQVMRDPGRPVSNYVSCVALKVIDPANPVEEPRSCKK